MTVEKITLIKRTIYVSTCKCGDRDVKDSNPPRERLCSCGEWSTYKEESYTGPEMKYGKVSEDTKLVNDILKRRI